MSNHKKIMVFGHFASGRTNLIQKVAKEETVPEVAINPMQAIMEFDNTPYNTEAVDFIDSSGIKLGESTVDYWNSLQNKVPQNLPADCIWYCIDGAKTAIQPADIEILKLAGEKAIVVITRSDLMTEDMIETMYLELEKIIPYERIVVTSAHNGLGLNKLLECSKNILYGNAKNNVTAKWDEYFAHQKSWLKNARELAEQYIRRGACQAFKISTGKPIPDPTISVLLLSKNHAFMFYRIGKCYGYPVNQYTLNLFYSLMPEAFSLGEDLSLNGSINSAYAYAAGYAVKAYFESDMTLEMKELNKIFTAAKENSGKIDWKNQ